MLKANTRRRSTKREKKKTHCKSISHQYEAARSCKIYDSKININFKKKIIQFIQPNFRVAQWVLPLKWNYKTTYDN